MMLGISHGEDFILCPGTRPHALTPPRTIGGRVQKRVKTLYCLLTTKHQLRV